MARALASGFVSAGLVEANNVSVADVVPAATEAFVQQIPGAHTCASNSKVITASDVIFLAVKPQNIASVAKSIESAFDDSKLLVSICAGVTIETLHAQFQASHLIRVMPNTPCLIGAGASAFSVGGATTSEEAAFVQQLLEAVGVVVQLEEKHLDAVTGLSGSGPAFVYQIIEALSDAGVSVGLTRPVAQLLAAQTVSGAAQMVQQTGEHPAVLKDRVASPGGTTIAGIQALESAGLRSALIGAVNAATKRSLELGRPN